MPEARRKKDRHSSEVVDKPLRLKDDKSSKKKAKFLNPRNSKSWLDKRNYTLKVYCKKCRRNRVGVCRGKTFVYFHCNEKGHFSRNCPSKLYYEDKKDQEKPQS